jgi:hypothetical protein
MLDYPDLEPAMRERFHGVIRDEVGAMSRRIRDLADEATRGLKARWPLEDMLGADLLSAAMRRIEALKGPRVQLDDIDTTLWLKVDSFSLLQALACLAERLADEYDIRVVMLRLAAAPQDNRAHLDLIWQGQTMSTETVMSWQMDAMTAGGVRAPRSDRARRCQCATWSNGMAESSGWSASGCAIVPSSASCCRWPASANSLTSPLSFHRAAGPSTTTSTCSAPPSRAANWPIGR